MNIALTVAATNSVRRPHPPRYLAVTATCTAIRQAVT